MAKNALISSPFFFGFLFLVVISFISEGQSCGASAIFYGSRIQKNCEGCEDYCTSLPYSGVKGSVYSYPSGTSYVCLCCTPRPLPPSTKSFDVMMS
ncbi:hypothetical protein MKW98_005052 [Papaver atlanticum]|uniref:Defensin-like protein n=1 Tax=Papaver atlanticum TaxID=357466 RepID=A0AAD4XWE8_9MAGN|nr:hypothetical protein MKW98_005052 [Papaver atlanticum]